MIEEKMPIEEKKKIIPFKGKPLVVGKQMTPLLILIYGPNGIGKSTFASHFKNPILIDFEKKSTHLDIHKQPVDTFQEFLDYLKWLIEQDHDYSTAIIDSIDQLESSAKNYVEKLPVYANNPSRLEYGRLDTYVAEQFENVIRLLDILFNEKKMNIIFTGHESITKSNDTRYPLFDKYHLRIHSKTSSIICNWVHCIFFANYDISFGEKEEIGFNRTRERAISNDRRILCTTGTANYLASNIYKLPRTIKLTETNETFITLINHIKNFYAQPTSEGEK